MMVWGMVVPYVGGAVEMAAMVLAFLAYNQFFDQSQLASPNATASSYMDRMERE